MYICRVPSAFPHSVQRRSNPESIALLLLQVLRTGVANAILIDSKHAIALRQTWRVIDLAHSRLASPLLQTQPRSRRMRDDVAADRFFRVRVEHRARSAIDLRNNLIRDDYRDAELVSKPLKRPHEFGEMGLPR